MEIGPIIRAMTRNKLGVVLISLQIAFTMTVIVNSLFIINERSSLMARPSGLDEANLFYLTSVGFGPNYNEATSVAEDLALLRQTPGIANATVTNAVPVSGSGSSTGVRTEPDETQPSTPSAVYRVDEQAVDTMNLDLIAGENFTATDILLRQSNEILVPQKAVVSLALAEAIFPGEGTSAVGRTIYVSGANPVQIVGIVNQLQAPWPSNTNVEQSLLLPSNIIDGAATYLIRSEPGQRDRLMLEIEELLANSNDARILIGLTSLEETRRESYRVDNAMSKVLVIVITTLVFITSMGIVGLAVFSINKRRKQIGTRRALGATHNEILRYFMLENFFISALGVTLGAVMTIAFNIFLVQVFNMPAMNWYYTPLGMIALILVGQVAVLGPSSGASKISPAIATRTI